MRQQRGFTLLELLLAMAIFAMLAVAGWQVFDSVSKSRERAQRHADDLAVLQYAYLQLQQDMGQVIVYQANEASTTDDLTNNSSTDPQATLPPPQPFMSVDGESVSFVRFADPDPRYQSSASVQRIAYVFANDQLIRRQYHTIHSMNGESTSLDSVLLKGVSAGRWQALMPEPSDQFPNTEGERLGTSATQTSRVANTANTVNTQAKITLLPKGVAVSFTYQDMPITWQWALAPKSLAVGNFKTANTVNDDNSNNDDNGGAQNDDAGGGV
ncbi:type II secretion system protein GspJ [Psychrobacter sp. L7]|uniref:type II secretion system minor pseudopilin GspJ n=1 Tax=Psychrobacter sp. L7 TaxID=1982756 RepID=UPI000C29B9C0|nr:type II secretion system minor pseudopilin GspJ [Psychrobacter sp. L7]PJX24376.1 type II secretion system protein GspJ [Psychrobacter sp. L7]